MANTRTHQGLAIQAAPHLQSYPKGIKVSKPEMSQLNITPAEFHGEWNYTIRPRIGGPENLFVVIYLFKVAYPGVGLWPASRLVAGEAEFIHMDLGQLRHDTGTRVAGGRISLAVRLAPGLALARLPPRVVLAGGRRVCHGGDYRLLRLQPAIPPPTPHFRSHQHATPSMWTWTRSLSPSAPAISLPVLAGFRGKRHRLAHGRE
jgi:DDE family transposase